ncbi:MAG: NOB1 family endonuclease [Thermoplasmataceae archaeon]
MDTTAPGSAEPGNIYVVDTSAIMSRRLDMLDRRLVFPSSVLEEIRKGKLRRLLDAISPDINVYTPSMESRSEVVSFATKSGDISVLSDTDIDVLALALELRATIITDDYAIENVAEFMGIHYVGSDLKPIQSKIKWAFRCTGCGKFYNSNIGTCRICGHPLKRIPVRKSGKK